MNDPQLNNYENLWPIRVYYEYRVRTALARATKLVSSVRRKRKWAPRARKEKSDLRPQNKSGLKIGLMGIARGSPTTSSSSGGLSSNSDTPPSSQAAYPGRTAPLQNPKPGGQFRRMYVGLPPPNLRKKRAAGSSVLSNPTPSLSQITQSVGDEGSDDELDAAPCSDVPWSRSAKVSLSLFLRTN